MRLFLISMLLLISSWTQADPVFSAGDIKFTGDTYISTLSDTETKGIGRIFTITQGDQVLWSTGDDGNFINFVFGGYTPVVSPTASIFNFQAASGYVDFFLNAGNIFDTSMYHSQSPPCPPPDDTKPYKDIEIHRYLTRVQYKQNNMGNHITVYKSAIFEASGNFTIEQIMEVLGVKDINGLELLALSKL